MTAKSILFLPANILCPVGSEGSVLEVALKKGVDIPHSCGAMGSCTTCRIFIESSGEPIPPRNELELDIAEMRAFADNERLSCQLPPLKDLVVRIPETLDGSDFE